MHTRHALVTAVALAAYLAALPLAATRAEPEKAPRTESDGGAIAQELLGWIAMHSDHDVRDINLPRIVSMTPRAITREFYGAAPHLMPEDGADERVLALYDATARPHGAIYVLAPRFARGVEHYDLPTDNPVWREMVLHELVHHVQWNDGTKEGWACPREGELEAYLLGGLYLRQRGVPDPMPNRRFWAHVYGRC